MSTPALDIPEFYPTQFGTSWAHLAQQKLSRLRTFAILDTNIQGKEKTYNQMSTSTWKAITTRIGPTVPDDTELEKRWLRLSPYDRVTRLDEWDEQMLGAITLPTSEYVQSHAYGYARLVDQTLINALGGTSYSGETGVTANSVQTGVTVSIGTANSNMNLAKLIEAKSILGKAEEWGQDQRDMGVRVCIALGQDQLDSLLLNVVQVQSSDYTAAKALVDGEVDNFLGMSFLRTELLPIDANNVRTCYAWVSNGVVFGTSQEMTTKMDVLPEHNHALQIRSKARVGATRLRETAVVPIACDEDSAS